MNRNASTSFTVVAISIFAIFIFSFASAPHAEAYAIGSDTPGNDYSVSTSFQNLLSPFDGFIEDLQGSNNVSISLPAASTTLPSLNISSGLKNILVGWLTEFDNWFYGLTGVRLSGIFFVLLNAILWCLHLAEDVVNWLLGLFH